MDKCVLLLLKHGAEVRWGHERSPLKLAHEKGHTKVMEILEDYRKHPDKYKPKPEKVPIFNKPDMDWSRQATPALPQPG